VITTHLQAIAKVWYDLNFDHHWPSHNNEREIPLGEILTVLDSNSANYIDDVNLLYGVCERKGVLTLHDKNEF